jgi:hypothetical protein
MFAVRFSGTEGARLSNNSFFHSTIQRKIHQDLMLLTKSRHDKSARRKRFTLRRLPIRNDALTKLTRILGRSLYPHLRQLSGLIPASAIRDMKINYSEQLPKTMRLLTADLNSPRSIATRTASSLGLIEILKSDDIHALGEKISGKKLVREPDCQIICYENGDFTGPHNDHHPENESARSGFVDVHIMLSEPSVSSQLLVYEVQPGLLNEVEEIGKGMAIAVYHLPFWHYTTPLQPRSKTRPARRWLLLATFDIEPRRR